MPTFPFRLRRVLEVRQRQEALRREELAATQTRWRQAQEALAQVASHRQAARESLWAELTALQLDVERVTRKHAYWSWLTERQGEAEQAVQEAGEHVEQARAALRQVRQARRALELLEARQRARWQQEVARKAQREADELALMRWVRGG